MILLICEYTKRSKGIDSTLLKKNPKSFANKTFDNYVFPKQRVIILKIQYSILIIPQYFP